MKKAVIIAIMCLLLTGCDDERKSDRIITYGHSNWTDDDTAITLKDGWFSCGYNVDYEKGQVIIQIEKVKE